MKYSISITICKPQPAHPITSIHFLDLQASGSDIRSLPDVLLHRLVVGLLALSSLVVELGLAVDGGTEHGDGHTAAIEEVNGDVEEEDAEEHGETLLKVTADGHGEGAGDLVGVEGGDVEEES